MNKIEIKTVKQLSDEIKKLMEENFPYVWVKGEIGPVKVHSSGHKYFSLKENEYLINAICWKRTPLSAPLEEGTIVECYGKIATYSSRSSYQIIVREVREIRKQGDILFQLEELKKKLQKEGVFDLYKKKPLPKFPESIAVLTSPTGAVFHDIMHRITNRYACCKVKFIPVAVQGAQSKESILKGLEVADELNTDIVILARGGGSLEDLWIFNDEDIVRKVANMQTPIVTAIGHETDTTLVDYASDLRAPTPTAAAELCIPDKIEIKTLLENKSNNSINFFYEKIKKYESIIDSLGDYNFAYKNTIHFFEQKIDHKILIFTKIISEKTKVAEQAIGQIESKKELLDNFFNQIENICSNIAQTGKLRLNQAIAVQAQISTFIKEKEEELKEKVLISSHNKRIKSAQDLKNAKEFCIKFIDGEVDAFVKN